MIEKIGIMGCGWLGFPLAKHFVAKNYKVYGSTTSKDKLAILEKEGIHPYKISLSADGIKGDIQGFLSNIHVLIINIPPKLRGGGSESFIEKIKHLHVEIKKNNLSKIIFVSSTSIYGEIDGEVSEETEPCPVSESGKQLLASEELLGQDGALKTAIVRFGGLIGPDRNPVTMLSDKQNLSNGNQPINLIHLEDCIQMLDAIVTNNYWNQIFNGVYPLHPTKREYYTAEALKRNIPPPAYQDDFSHKTGKIVISKNFLDKNHFFYTSIVS